VRLFVSRMTQKTTPLIFTKFDGKMAHGQRNKLLDYGDPW